MAHGGRLSPFPLAALSTCFSLVLLLSTFRAPAAGQKWVEGQCNGKWRTTHGEGNLPELPSDTHGPDSPHWENSVAICALMKAENSTDVREWLMYYKWLGVDHVYLTENADEPTPWIRSQVNDFVTSGFLTYAVDGTTGAQLILYRRCMDQHYHKHNWMAFLDLDEFLVIREKPAMKLPQFLDRYKYEPALSVHWVLVGPSGQHARPQAGGVLRTYTQCSGEASHVIKTIANTYYLSNTAGHAHNCEFRDGRRSVDEKFMPIVPRHGHLVCSAVPPAVSNLTRTPVPYENGTHHYDDAGAASPHRSIDHVALFHYSTKSQADFAVKVRRGSSHPGSAAKTWDFFEKISSETQFTGGLCGIPQSLADECCPIDKLTVPDPWKVAKLDQLKHRAQF